MPSQKNVEGAMMTKSTQSFCQGVMAICVGLTILAGPSLAKTAAKKVPPPSPNELHETALALAELLRDGRQVISLNQPLINDPSLGAKGLTGAKVLALASDMFREHQGRDIASYPDNTRTGQLLRKLADAIEQTMDEHQDEINTKDVAFKGFIPAVFGRLVSERFIELADGAAKLKVTAPMPLVRNRLSRPDAWENEVIETHFLSPAWQKGALFESKTEVDGHSAFRLLIPEYYGQSCLSCHGNPKGEVDRTGYPKEGAKEGDLGGVISIVLPSK
jgi:Protein of unknown function (DUF3365)